MPSRRGGLRRCRCGRRGPRRARLLSGLLAVPGDARVLRGGRAFALEVDDHPVGIVERVDTVAGGAFEVEDDTRGTDMAAHPDLPDDVVLEGQRGVPELLRRPRVLQVDEHTRRALEPLLVKRCFAFELQRDAHRFGQHLPADGPEHRPLAGDRRRRWRRRRRRNRGRCSGSRSLVEPLALIGCLADERAGRELRTYCGKQSERLTTIDFVPELPEGVGREPCRIEQRVVAVAAGPVALGEPLVLRDEDTDAAEHRRHAFRFRPGVHLAPEDLLAADRLGVGRFRRRPCDGSRADDPRDRQHREDGALASGAAHPLPRSNRGRPAPHAACRRRPAKRVLRPPSCPRAWPRD